MARYSKKFDQKAALHGSHVRGEFPWKLLCKCTGKCGLLLKKNIIFQFNDVEPLLIVDMAHHSPDAPGSTDT